MHRILFFFLLFSNLKQLFSTTSLPIVQLSSIDKSGLYVIQFGSGTTFMALAQTNNIVSNASTFAGIGFQDPKLFAWTGKHEEHDMFTVSTNITLSKPNVWGGVRLDFTNITQSLRR
jgi:hypothetical protein